MQLSVRGTFLCTSSTVLLLGFTPMASRYLAAYSLDNIWGQEAEEAKGHTHNVLTGLQRTTCSARTDTEGWNSSGFSGGLRASRKVTSPLLCGGMAGSLSS